MARIGASRAATLIGELPGAGIDGERRDAAGLAAVPNDAAHSPRTDRAVRAGGQEARVGCFGDQSERRRAHRSCRRTGTRRCPCFSRRYRCRCTTRWARAETRRGGSTVAATTNKPSRQARSRMDSVTLPPQEVRPQPDIAAIVRPQIQGDARDVVDERHRQTVFRQVDCLEIAVAVVARLDAEILSSSAV